MQTLKPQIYLKLGSQEAAAIWYGNWALLFSTSRAQWRKAGFSHLGFIFLCIILMVTWINKTLPSKNENRKSWSYQLFVTYFTCWSYKLLLKWLVGRNEREVKYVIAFYWKSIWTDFPHICSSCKPAKRPFEYHLKRNVSFECYKWTRISIYIYKCPIYNYIYRYILFSIFLQF